MLKILASSWHPFSKCIANSMADSSDNVDYNRVVHKGEGRQSNDDLLKRNNQGGVSAL